MDEQVIKLALSVFGTEGVVKLREESARLKLGMEAAADSFAKGQSSAAEFSRATNAYARDLGRVNDLLGQFERAQAADGAAASAAAQKMEAEATAAKQLAAALAEAADAAKHQATYEVAGPTQIAGGYELAHVYDLVEQAETRVATSARAAGTAVEASAGRSVTVVKQTAAATDDAKSRMGGLQTAIRGVGYGLSDVFANNGPIGSKIGGFANNVGGIITGIGQAMGKMGPTLLATAALMEIGVTGIGAALNALGVKTVDDFLKLITGGVIEAETGLKGLEDRIKELTDRPHLIPIEILELDQKSRQVAEMKANLQAIEEMQKSQTHAESISGKAVRETLAEAREDTGKVVGAQGVSDRIRAQLVAELEADGRIAAAAADEAKARRNLAEIEKGREGMSVEELELTRGQVLAAQEAVAEAAKRAAKVRSDINKVGGEADLALGRIVDTAQKGAGAAMAQAQEQLARRLEQVGLVGTAAEVGFLAPEAMEGREEKKEAGKVAEQNRKKQEADAKKAEAERLRLNAASIADQEREQAEAVSQTRRTFGEELKEQATAGLVGGIDRDKLKADLKAKLRAQLAQADDFRKPVQEAVAEEVVDKVVGDIKNADVRKAMAAGARAEKKAQTAEQKEGAGIAEHIAKVSDVDEQAAALAAQIRAQGGVNGRRMNVEQQQRYVQSRIFNDLRKRVGGQQAQIASGPLAERAFQTADDAAGVLGRGVNQQGRAGAMGLSNQGKLIAVAQMLAVQAQRAAMAQAQQGQAINRLMRDTAVGTRSLQRQGR